MLMQIDQPRDDEAPGGVDDFVESFGGRIPVRVDAGDALAFDGNRTALEYLTFSVHGDDITVFNERFLHCVCSLVP
ncbi:hypothetical protein [Paraburkholderia fungorum]|uniref:hypothetical protein n=1 Tax=Paraburkholderia fungorum TaxID=134537 RepID=UPI00217DE522|nr:hypothetical protein [Paraburkholderia fungorum]